MSDIITGLIKFTNIDTYIGGDKAGDENKLHE